MGRISVALAAYKGEQYIAEQLDSILPQLGEDDEIIVSDDLPGGETQKTVELYAYADSRVKYIKGVGKGVAKNFENAISECCGDYIFLCDQDDVWLPDKVERVMAAFGDNVMAVLHNAKVSDENLNVVENSFFSVHYTRTGIISNILKNSYMGCCMAFDSRLKKVILPFPRNIPMHDQWIGLMAELHGRVNVINEPLIIYRRHGHTVTGGSTSSAQKITWRATICKEMALRSMKERTK